MTAEDSRSNWDGIVVQIFKEKLDKAQEAQSKVAEVARMQEEAAARSILEAQERTISAEMGIASRWGLLESLHVRELLEGLNASKNVWRGLGTIERDQFTVRYGTPHWSPPPTERNTAVEYSLSAPIIELGWTEGTGSWLGDTWLEGTPSVSYPKDATTYIKIGITPGISKEEFNTRRQTIFLPETGTVYDFVSNETGQKQPEGAVLYVIDSHVDLSPVERANTFIVGRTGKIPVDLYSREAPKKGLFVIEAKHPQVSEVLAEVLKRSCIRRAEEDLLPFQLKEKGDQIMQQHMPLLPPQPKGFWGRIFG